MDYVAQSYLEVIAQDCLESRLLEHGVQHWAAASHGQLAELPRSRGQNQRKMKGLFGFHIQL